MEFKAYTRRFVDDLIVIGEETLPSGFQMADPVHPAFDLGGYVRGLVTDTDAEMWVSSSDYRWSDWDEVTGPRLDEALADIGGRERMAHILRRMLESEKSRREAVE